MRLNRGHLLTTPVVNYYASLARFVTKKKVKLQVAHFVDTACVQPFPDYYKITLSGNFPFDFMGLSEGKDYTDDQYKEIQKEIREVYLGLTQHEVGHIIMTDFGSVLKIINVLSDCDAKPFVGLYKQFHNALEDHYLEVNLKNHRVFSKIFLNKVNNYIFTEESYKETIADSLALGDFFVLVNFLMYKFMNPDVITIIPPVYQKIEQSIEDVVDLIIHTHDGDTRNRRILAMLYQILVNLLGLADEIDEQFIYFGMTDKQIKELFPPLLDHIPKQEEQPGEGKGDGEGDDEDNNDDTQNGKGGEGKTLEELIKEYLELLPENPNELNEDQMKELEKNPVEDDKNPPEADDSSLKMDVTLDDTLSIVSHQHMDTSNTEGTISGVQQHYYFTVTNYIKENAKLKYSEYFKLTYEGVYRMLYEEVSDHVREIYKIISEFKRLNFAKMERNLLNGKKIDTKNAINPAKYKVMKKKKPKLSTPDLSFSFLIDASTSMWHEKRMGATKSYIAFSEACKLLDIPTSTYIFSYNHLPEYVSDSYGHGNMTTCFKNLHDPYDSVKEGIMYYLCGDAVDGVKPHGGNEDEVNLNYVSRLIKQTSPHKENIIIVLSDGATCGSKDTLKRVAENVYRDGIDVLAIGLFDHHVSQTYKDYYIIDDDEAFNQLPNYLITYLKNKIMRGK